MKARTENMAIKSEDTIPSGHETETAQSVRSQPAARPAAVVVTWAQLRPVGLSNSLRTLRSATTVICTPVHPQYAVHPTLPQLGRNGDLVPAAPRHCRWPARQPRRGLRRQHVQLRAGWSGERVMPWGQPWSRRGARAREGPHAGAARGYRTPKAGSRSSVGVIQKSALGR